MKESSPAQKKIDEYVERIITGKETKESVIDGLSPSFVSGINLGLEEIEKRRAEDQKKIANLREKILNNNKPQELTIENIVSDIESKIRNDFENMSIEEIKEQIKLQHDLISWKHKGNLSTDLFSVGKANIYEDENGVMHTWESVDGNMGKFFDAHGIAKAEQLSKLLKLLDEGVDSSKDFYTAPFDLPKEDKSGAGAAFGTGDGTAYKDGIAVITSGYKKNIKKDGIEHVFLNDVFNSIKTPLEKAYPQYKFHLLSEQKQILESEAKSNFDKKFIKIDEQ